MVAVPAQAPLRPPSLLESTKKSTAVWQADLQSLFDHAKDRFPDVVWELVDEDAPMDAESEEVWGHKAIVYARAPPSFQARYFSFRPPPIASPVPFSSSPTPTHPAQSSLSLTLGVDYPMSLRSASPFRTMSPTPSNMTGTLMRIPTANNPTLFQNELEYLYTGKGFGEAFEFLFDTAEKREEGDAEDNRIDKLRKDLVFMWRSRLYSDVRIEIQGKPPPGAPEEETTAAFSSHRFVLVSRSPYFFDQLVTYGGKTAIGEVPTVRLPTPPFTPPSLHFILGFLYTGTLNFSNRTYDLDTAFHIMRCATYLQLQSLYDEVQARIVQEMMHGLFHAFLEFEEYERITGSKWGTGGCRCRQCARRAPRMLEFSLQPDVKNAYLERGTRRALVGLFGEGWCTPEFATLPQKTKDGLLKGLAKRTTPLNIFPLLFAAQYAMNKLNGVLDAWADGTREMVLSARKRVDEVLCGQVEQCFEQAEWLELMDADGGRFEDGERVEWVMESVKRGLTEGNAAMVYQTLVSSVLLKPHPTEPGETLLSSTSHIRVQVEQTRVDVLNWLRRRWAGVRQEGGFDVLEGWAIKEISHEIDIPVEDLVNPTPAPPRSTVARASQRRPQSRADDTESISAQSLRASVHSRNSNRRAGTAAARRAEHANVHSSAASVRSVARSTVSTASRATASTVSPSTRASRLNNKDTRPDSKLLPSSSSQFSMDIDAPEAPAIAQAGAQAASKRSGTAARRNVSGEKPRPRSVAGSVASVRSHASTIRKSVSGGATSGGAGANTAGAVERTNSGPAATNTMPPRAPAAPRSTLRPTASASSSVASASRPPSRPGSRPGSSATRPVSTVSTRSAASSTFKTAPESIDKRASMASTASTASSRSVRPTAASTAASRIRTKPPVPPVPSMTRSRKSSTASVTSTASSVAASRAGTTPRGKTAGTTTSGKGGLAPGNTVKRSTSSTSMRSNASTASKKVIVKRPSAEKEKDKEKESDAGAKKPERALPAVPSRESLTVPVKDEEAPETPTKGKDRDRSDTITADNRSSTASGGKKSDGGTSGTSSRSTVRRRGSNETIKTLTAVSSAPMVKKSLSKDGNASVSAPAPAQQLPPPTVEIHQPQPRGATLELGIPCIISSKRQRFRAFARYIGEVEGELGPWVGVEVPFGEQWQDEQLEGRQWNDGSWGGIRYFNMGMSSEWGDEEYTGRKRQMDWSGGYGHHKGTKRGGDHLAFDRKKRMRSASPAVSDVSMTECRGLFVRPQQVLFVMDAVGPDY